MSTNRADIRMPAPTPPVQLTPELLAVLAASSNSVVTEWFAAKLQQPSWRQLLFTPATGPTINDTYSGPFTPRSVVVFNPTSQPVYVSTGGTNPLAVGIATEPQAISPRLPILASNLSVGLAPDTDLEAQQYLVHVFRFATPD